MARTKLSTIQRRNQTAGIEVWEEEDGSIVEYIDGNASVTAKVNLTGRLRLLAAGLDIAGELSAPGSLKTVLIGDSITGFEQYALTLTTLTRSGGVATATLAAHGLATGAQVRIFGAVDDTFNGCVTVTVTGANTFTYPCIGGDGSTTGMYFYSRDSTYERGWFTWASMLLGGRLSLENNGAVGGVSIGYYTPSTLETEVFNYNPDVVFAMLGTNNLAAAALTATPAAALTDATTAYNSLVALVDTLLGSVPMVVLMTIPPVGSTFANQATASPRIAIYNELIRRYAQKTKGVVLVDAYQAIVDPIAATPGTAATGMLEDLLHPTAKGAYKIGKAVFVALQNLIPACNTLIGNNLDNATALSTSSNVFSSGLMTGSGGSATTITGTVATNWVIDGVANTTGTTTNAAQRSDLCGYDQVTTATSTGASGAWRLRTGAGVAGLSLGQWFQLEAEVSITGVSGSNLSGVNMYASVTVDGTMYTVGNTNAYAASAAYPNEDIGPLMLRSKPFFVPSGSALTTQNIYFYFRTSAAGTAYVAKVGRVSCRKVAAPSQ